MKLPFARCELYHLYATRAAVLANQRKPLLSLNPTVSCPCQWLPFVYLSVKKIKFSLRYVLFHLAHFYR